MIYRIYGQKDTTIYELNTRKEQNTGLDEVLEVTKFFDEESNSVHMGNSRILSKFDLTEISKSISLNEIPSTANYQLNLVVPDLRHEYQRHIPCRYSYQLVPAFRSL